MVRLNKVFIHLAAYFQRSNFLDEGWKGVSAFDFMVLNLSFSSLIAFSFLCFTVRCSRGSFAVGEQQW